MGAILHKGAHVVTIYLFLSVIPTPNQASLDSNLQQI